MVAVAAAGVVVVVSAGLLLFEYRNQMSAQMIAVGFEDVDVAGEEVDAAAVTAVVDAAAADVVAAAVDVADVDSVVYVVVGVVAGVAAGVAVLPGVEPPDVGLSVVVAVVMTVVWVGAVELDDAVDCVVVVRPHADFVDAVEFVGVVELGVVGVAVADVAVVDDDVAAVVGDCCHLKNQVLDLLLSPYHSFGVRNDASLLSVTDE